ncbi:hypothetical protein BURKHO8Y_270007 [Burkholderia sp. 8Y]|nr:hypothetical protein BURKHO8Y_270007 [Burkholderia sp. 8Y]
MLETVDTSAPRRYGADRSLGATAELWEPLGSPLRIRTLERPLQIFFETVARSPRATRVGAYAAFIARRAPGASST